MKNKVKIIGVGLISGIMLLLLCIFAGLMILFFVRGIYEINIDNWHLCEISGLSKEEIMTNFNAMMDWCVSFNSEPFTLPTLSYSEHGAIHFEECKVIFRGFFVVGIASAIILPFILKYFWKKRKKSVFFIASATSVIIPLVVLGACAVDFDKAFVTFHQIFFNNDYWIFDAAKDQIITILPEDYFYLCGAIISGIVIIGAITVLIFGIYLSRFALKSKSEA